MPGPKDNLDGIVMTNLAAGKTAPEAAAEAGVSERTVYRRMEQPEFRQSVLELRGRMMDDVAGRFAEAAGAGSGPPPAYIRLSRSARGGAAETCGPGPA